MFNEERFFSSGYGFVTQCVASSWSRTYQNPKELKTKVFYLSLYVGVPSFKQVQSLQDLIMNILNLTNVGAITCFDMTSWGLNIVQ